MPVAEKGGGSCPSPDAMCLHKINIHLTGECTKKHNVGYRSNKKNKKINVI